MKLLVFSNVYIAAAGLLLTHQTYLQLDLAPRWAPLPIFVFAATLFIYNLDRLSEARDDDAVEESVRHRWIRRHRRSLSWLAALGACGAGAMLYFLPVRTWLVLVPLAIVSVAYSLPLVWGPEGPYRLKDVAGLKIFLIACVWAGATGVLPAVEHLGAVAPSETALIGLERGLYVFALTLPFDIRDLERDRAAGVRTIPMYLGAEPTRRLAVATMVAFALLSGWHYGWTWTSWTPPIVASAAITGGALAAGGADRDELYYVGVLDGMMIVQWGLVAAWSML